MHYRIHHRLQWLALPVGIALWSATPVAAAPVLPEMAVPKTSHPPVLDGKLSPGEWDRAAACTGFVQAFNGQLAKIQTTAWMTFDDQYIYVAFKNYRAESLKFLSAKARRIDDEAIVYDPSNEIWISPPTSPAVTYQTLLNVYPTVLDVKMIPSLGYSSKAWSGKWEIASSQDNDIWIVEARAPIRSFGMDHIADGDIWRALFATDVLADSDRFRAWAPGGAFVDIARHGYLHFTNEGPAFQLLDVESIFSGKPVLAMQVAGATRNKSTVEVTARFGAEAETRTDIVLRKTVSPEPGHAENFDLSADLTAVGAVPKFCEITAKSGGTILYHQVFPIVVDGFKRRAPPAIQASPYVGRPFGLESSYAPISKKLLVRIDRYYVPRRGAFAGGRVELLEPNTLKKVAGRPLAPFHEDYSEFALDLSNLTVPIETELAWQRKTAVAPAEFVLKATLSASDGTEVSASIPVKLMGYQFSWLPNDIGISDKVIPPWTPVEYAGNTVSLWNKRYQFNGAGLAENITNSSALQLSGPMKLETLVDGRRIEIAGPGPRLENRSESAVELSGEAQGGPVHVKLQTRVEFDGFVWNVMTVAPTKANVARLSMIVTMPEEEGQFFVTTSGGWSSYHGKTPERWDSRESSLTNMVGNFVPYILLTDSERGFCWFADNEKGWRLDPAVPTQEVERHSGVVTLRINFITRSGSIDQPMTIQYGWMVTPQKPQPKGWRAYLIGYQKYFPQATPVFWNDADWAVSWPYYSSPFPHDYGKSRTLLAAAASKGVVGCVGNIAHAIARYTDYQGRPFQALASEWGITPGDAGDGNVARSRGPNDFQLFHFDRWSKLSGLSCLYFDENYLYEDRNYLTGGAYLMADELVQPGYDYLGLREYNKRLRYMFHDNGKPLPNLWEHTTGGQAVYAWMPDVSMEGENVAPSDLSTDYIDALPASRLRSIGMGRNLGSAPFIMNQAARHDKGEIAKALTHQLVGWVMAHDVLPEEATFWPVLASELELWRDDVRFIPYWKTGQGIASLTPGVEASAHVRPGNAVLWIVNENRAESLTRIRLAVEKLGLDPAQPVQCYDAETGVRFPLDGGLLLLTVPGRSWRAVRMFQPKRLAGNLTFLADFEGEAAAVEAYGGRYPLGTSLPGLVAGKGKGKALPIDQAVSFPARLHISRDKGRISFYFRALPGSSGSLLAVGGFTLGISDGKLDATLGNSHLAVTPAYTSSYWSEVELTWTERELQVQFNGAIIAKTKLAEPLQILGCGRGAEIRDLGRRIEPTKVIFGPLRNAALDDLRMSL